MGGLIKRKNRSLPNLRADDDDGQEEQQQEPEEDEYVGLPAAGPPTEDALCNPNLEKSKLMMRRSFYSSSEILILYWCEVGVTRLLSHNTRRKKIVNFVSAKCPEWIDQKSPTVRCGLSDN